MAPYPACRRIGHGDHVRAGRAGPISRRLPFPVQGLIGSVDGRWRALSLRAARAQAIRPAGARLIPRLHERCAENSRLVTSRASRAVAAAVSSEWRSPRLPAQQPQSIGMIARCAVTCAIASKSSLILIPVEEQVGWTATASTHGGRREVRERPFADEGRCVDHVYHCFGIDPPSDARQTSCTTLSRMRSWAAGKPWTSTACRSTGVDPGRGHDLQADTPA
jgi:hypothetical protein